MMLAMYLAYSIFLARDNQHSFNRAILLLVYIVSFTTIPLLSAIGNATAGSPSLTLDGLEILGTAEAQPSMPLWGTLLIWIFIAGALLAAAKTIYTSVRLTKVIRSGKKIAHHGYTLVVTDNEKFAPFSWMRYVVISRKDYDNNYSAIAAHELKHVASRHWIDLLLAQAVCIINWFNPAAWLMRDELMLVHEYQADMAVIDKGHDPQEYQLLLIKKAVGSRFPSLANSLNHSKLKKRITMMYKQKSGAGRKFKALALVPMLALALGLASVPAVRATVTAIGNSKVSVSKVSENPDSDKADPRVFKISDISKDNSSTTVIIDADSLGNNLNVSGATLTSGGRTYNANAISSNMTNGSATIIATFPFAGDPKGSSVSLTVNGEDISFDCSESGLKGRMIKIKKNSNNASSYKTAVTIDGTQTENMEFYLDGKKIDKLSDIKTDDIASITVDKNKNRIMITTK